MKSINLPLAVCASLCMLVSCENKSKVNSKDITLRDVKQEEERKAVPPPQQIAPLDEAKTIADNENFFSDSIASPQQSQKPKDITKNIQPPRIEWDKKIIKNAIINAEVKNYGSFYTSLREKVKNLGGYVAQEEQNQSDYKIENSLAIKVPVDKFDDALAALSKGTDKINEKKITSQDVTSEYIDTKSRMETKKEMMLRYMDFLKQAKNIKDVLSVQSEINDIQEEIESATGQINYLSHSSSYSTINITFYQVLNVSAKDIKEPSFLSKIADSFKTGLRWTGELILGLVSIWPVIFFFVGVGILIRKYIRIRAKPVKASL
jgi:hypothetical protein